MTIEQINQAIWDGLQTGKFTREEVQKISDGVHTFADVYNRAAHWNALALRLMHLKGLATAKSFLHHDYGRCPTGTFIVGAMTPFGQVTQHYQQHHWPLFQIPEFPRFPWAFDGHRKEDVNSRIGDMIHTMNKFGKATPPLTPEQQAITEERLEQISKMVQENMSEAEQLMFFGYLSKLM